MLKSQHKRCSNLTLLAAVIAILASMESAQAQLNLDWLSQWGTTESETGVAVALDGAGNPYLAGVLGTLAVQEETHDVYVRRYLSDGTFDWLTSVGAGAGGGSDSLAGLAVDSAGNAYITGRTLEGLGVSGDPQGGREGAFAARVDANGSVAWTDQIDNTNNNGFERSYGVALDNAGNVRVAGISQNGLDGNSPDQFPRFLRQYSSVGTLQSTSTFGSGEHLSGTAIAVDNANFSYIAGDVNGSLFGAGQGFADAALMRLNPDGSVAWTRQLGTSGNDSAKDVAVDTSGNIFITGSVNGDLGDGVSAGQRDAFLARYDANGSLLWAQQFGSSSTDIGEAIAIDGNGNIYVVGTTFGDLTGNPQGSQDFFIAQYSYDGIQNWIMQAGTDTFDFVSDVVVDDQGNVYVAGSTEGDLGGPNASNEGGSDAFLAKYSVPEPATLTLLGLSGLLFTRRTRRPKGADRNGVRPRFDTPGERGDPRVRIVTGSVPVSIPVR